MYKHRSTIATVVAAALLALGSMTAAAKELPHFTHIVDRTGPAVVNISATKSADDEGEQSERGGGATPPELNEFFRRFFGEPQRPPRQYERESHGSGFIISGDGYVLTNYHVIQGADEITVRLADRRELEAEIVGSDEPSDIALLKVDASGLPDVSIGSSDALQAGEWVVAIGSPFAFDHSVTAGIVSAKGRSFSEQQYVPFIQTDVPINQGNSGGPLINLDGEVVGINSQIFSKTGGYMGLSFAIPIEVAMDVVDQLKKKGKVSRGWLGVSIQSVDAEMAEYWGLDKPKGAIVAQVVPDSPADKAGLKAHDIILSFAGEEVSRSADLPPLVGQQSPGTSVDVEVIRDGERKTIEVELGELEEGQQQAATAVPGGDGDTGGKLGLAVGALTDEQRKEADVDSGGVLVREIEPGPARRAGLRRGDIILSVGNTDVRGPEHFAELVEGLEPGESVPLLVQRGSQRSYIAITPRE